LTKLAPDFELHFLHCSIPAEAGPADSETHHQLEPKEWLIIDPVDIPKVGDPLPKPSLSKESSFDELTTFSN
jgi:hypothetical protein